MRKFEFEIGKRLEEMMILWTIIFVVLCAVGVIG